MVVKMLIDAGADADGFVETIRFVREWSAIPAPVAYADLGMLCPKKNRATLRGSPQKSQSNFGPVQGRDKWRASS